MDLMKYTLVEGAASNYELVVTVTNEQFSSMKESSLQSFQKEVSVPWFRKGHVPLAMVEENIKPGYLEMSMLEHVVHQTMTKVLDENKSIQFIGQPYDFNPLQLRMPKEEGMYEVTFKIDIYPQPKEKDAKWKKASMKKINATVTQEKRDSVLHTIAKQYADYTSTDEVTQDTVSKVVVKYFDKDGNELGKRTVFVGKEEFEQEASSKKLFMGCKKDEEVEKKYTKSAVPSFMDYQGEDKPSKFSFVIQDIQHVVVPELTDAFVAEKFGGDGGIESKKALEERIEQTLQETQSQQELEKSVDDLLAGMIASFDLTIPETFVQEELKHRIKRMEQQYGGSEGFQKFIEKMGEEKAKEYLSQMRDAAKKSLEKFFLLRTLVEHHEITADWNTPLDAEKKLYAKMTGDADLFNQKEDTAEEEKPKKKAATKKSTAKKASTKKKSD